MSQLLPPPCAISTAPEPCLFPVNSSSAQSAANLRRTFLKSRPMAIRILVVDDASFIRDMLKKHLRDRLPGVEVFDAVDGNRALAVMKTQAIDLILSDWEMPNMSGEELLRAVRANPGSATTPFIMVTSRGDRSYVIKAVERSEEHMSEL